MLQKILLSLLIAVILCAVIAVLAFTGLFDLVETRFYNPSITKTLVRETAVDTEVIQDWLSDLHNYFASSLNEPPVRRSFLSSQRSEDIFERSRIYGLLLTQTEGLQSVRFVDSEGKRIHFSTYVPDIVSQDDHFIAYRDYIDTLPFDQVKVPDHNDSKLIMDRERDRIIFSFPFYDSMDVYRGTALFSVSVRAAARRLVSMGRIKIGDDVTVINTPPGIISGCPETSKNEILAGVSQVWGSGLSGLTPFDSGAAGISMVLVSAKAKQGVFYGRLINEAIFAFPRSVKVLLLLSIFFTVYLAVFFCFNLRQDSMMIIQNRLKELQISLIEQFYAQKNEVDWTRWFMELEQRRKGIHAEIKRGLDIRRSEYSETEIDSLVDKSWDELEAFISAQQKTASGIDEETMQNILNRILQSLPVAAQQAAAQAAAQTAAQQEAARPATEAEPGEADAMFPVEDVEELVFIPEIEKQQNHIEAARESAGAGQEHPRSGGLLAAAMQKRAAIHFAVHGNTPPRKLKLIDEEFDIVLEEKVDEEMEEPKEYGKFNGPEKLEELEGVDEAEELEEAAELEELEADNAGILAPSLASSPSSGTDIKELESKIEFAEADSGAEEPEETLNTELEIVSPFSSMFSPLESESILEEPDGVPHINGSVLSPDRETEANLDQNFRELVSSVIKEK
jgi:hypothetical protein